MADYLWSTVITQSPSPSPPPQIVTKYVSQVLTHPSPLLLFFIASVCSHHHHCSHISLAIDKLGGKRELKEKEGKRPHRVVVTDDNGQCPSKVSEWVSVWTVQVCPQFAGQTMDRTASKRSFVSICPAITTTTITRSRSNISNESGQKKWKRDKLPVQIVEHLDYLCTTAPDCTGHCTVRQSVFQSGSVPSQGSIYWWWSWCWCTSNHLGKSSSSSVSVCRICSICSPFFKDWKRERKL